MISKNDFAIEIDSVVYYFYMNEDHNIYFREIRDKTSGDENILIENSLNLISAILNINKTIYLFVESYDNELVLYEFTQGLITSKKLLAKGFIGSDYMKIVAVNTSLHLFYAQKIDNCFNLYHCILTKDLVFSSPIFIDKVFRSDFDPFIINTSNDNLYISYIKLSNYYYFIYRTYDLNRNIWSSNNIINSSSSPISDYDLLLNKDYILYCYKTDSDLTTSISFGYGVDGNFVKSKITEEVEDNIFPFLTVCDNRLLLTYYKPISKKLKTFQIISNFDEILDMDLSHFISVKKIALQSQNNLLSNFASLMQFQCNYMLTNSVFFMDLLPKTPENIVVKNKVDIDLADKTAKKPTSINQEKDQLISKQTALIRELQQRLQMHEDNLKFSMSNNIPQTQEISSLQKKISILSDKIDNKEFQLTNVEMLLEKNERYIAELEEKIETKDKIISGYQYQFENKKNITLNDQILNKNKEIGNLLDEISKLKTELYNENLQIDQLKDTIDLKEKQILFLEKELNQLNNSLKSMTDHNTELEKKSNQSIIKKIFSKE